MRIVDAPVFEVFSFLFKPLCFPFNSISNKALLFLNFFAIFIFAVLGTLLETADLCPSQICKLWDNISKV